MEKIGEYAKRHNVTYEAVRQQVVRYKKDLEGHITKKGNAQYLDDEAVKFLDEKRQDNPVVVIQADKDETIERLEREKSNLLIELARSKDETARSREEVAEGLKKQLVLLEEKSELQTKLQLIETQQENERLSAENRALKLESHNKILADENERLTLEIEELRLKVEQRRSLWSRLFGKE